MRRLLTVLAPWMAISGAWAQADTRITVDYTVRGSYVDMGARIGGHSFVSSSLLRRLGWTVDSNNGTLTILAEGRAFDLQPKIVSGTRLYDIDEALGYVGAATTWDDKARVLTVLSQVRAIEKTDRGIRFDGTLTVVPRAFRLNAPDRMVIDFAGASLPPSVGTKLPAGYRATQLDTKTVRVVIESPAMAQQAVPDLAAARNFDIELKPGVPAAAKLVPMAQLGTPIQGPDQRAGVTLTVPLSGKTDARASAVFLDPTTIQLSLPKSSAPEVGPVRLRESQWLKSVDVDDDHQGISTVTLKLDRPLAFQLSTTESGISLTLTKPRYAGGLAGKVIVVDAGHGGKDNGAIHAGVQEKHMTLAMAKIVARDLSNAGASVIMTRTDDTFVSLSERPGIANRSHADLFISCHFNSNSVDESRSGIIIFHHKDTSMGQLLAACISHEIGKEKQLPEIGVWSDGKIYDSGFAVLRGSSMPSVLMELGFLNHSRDRGKIQSEDFREAVAQAVVRGVKEFFGDGKN